MTDKEKLQRILEYHDNSDIETIFMSYLARNEKDFSVMRMKTFIDLLNQEYLYPMIKKLDEARFVANERATYLKSYLDGTMWEDEETARKYLQPQIDNAQAIIDVCKRG